MKIVVFLLLVTTCCFGQKMMQREFLISEIDSLSKKESCFQLFDYSDKIHVEKTTSNSDTKIIGEGYGTWKINAYFIDSLYFNRLSREQQKRYDDRNTCFIIRANYLITVRYSDGSTESEIITFYFNNNHIFYVKYQKENFTIESSFHAIDKKLEDNKTLKDYLIAKANEIEKIWNDR